MKKEIWYQTGMRFFNPEDAGIYLLVWVNGFTLVDVQRGHYYCPVFNDQRYHRANEKGLMEISHAGLEKMLKNDNPFVRILEVKNV